MADLQKLSSLLDKTLQFAGESEDERNPDAQHPTPKAFASRRPTSNIGYGRGAEVGRGRGVGVDLAVGVGVGVAVGVGVGVPDSELA